MHAAALLAAALGSAAAPPPPPAPPPHPCAAGSPHAAALFCNASAAPEARARDLVGRLSLLEKATIVSINGGAPGQWASEEFGLHVTGYTECSHASGSPHGSSSSPHNDWRCPPHPQPAPASSPC